MTETILQINSLQDLLDNWDYINDETRYIEYGHGGWWLYEQNNSGGWSENKDNVKFNSHLMNTLLDLGYLDFQECVVSSDAVMIFKLKPVLKLDNPLKLLKDLIWIFANERFKSKSHLQIFLEANEYKSSWCSQFAFGSYWGGTRYTNALRVKDDNATISIPYGENYSFIKHNMFRKNQLFKDCLMYWLRLQGLKAPNLRDITQEKFNQIYYKELPKQVSEEDVFVEQIPAYINTIINS